MEIGMVRLEKHQCEAEIGAILRILEEQTACIVLGINLERTHVFGKPPEIISVHLDMRIEAYR